MLLGQTATTTSCQNYSQTCFSCESWATDRHVRTQRLGYTGRSVCPHWVIYMVHNTDRSHYTSRAGAGFEPTSLALFGFGPCGFEPRSSQTNDIKIDSCHNLQWRSALLGKLAQCQDNALSETAGHGSGSLVFQSGGHYKVTMSCY